MTFKDALKVAASGKRIRRKGWEKWYELDDLFPVLYDENSYPLKLLNYDLARNDWQAEPKRRKKNASK